MAKGDKNNKKINKTEKDSSLRSLKENDDDKPGKDVKNTDMENA